MKTIQLLFLFGAAYLAVVHAQEPAVEDNEVAVDEDAEEDETAEEESAPADDSVTKPVCACTREYKPICGNDGVTYSNPCEFKCVNDYNKKNGKPEITVRCEAPCDKCVQCICTRDYKPVCGSNGVTYSNKCLYNCANDQNKNDGRPAITIKCQGTCEQCSKDTPCVCTRDYKPVCGSDGVTYSNKCVLNCENEKRARDGKCALTVRCPTACDKCQKPCVCPFNYAPVCGSDGQTYGNECSFNCENDRRKFNNEKPIVIKCKNECAKCEQEDVCPLNYLPVCGSDGVTYSNDCMLKSANKRAIEAGKPAITVRCENECSKCQNTNKVSQEGEVEDVCPLNYAPVCGSNGVTYDNDCYFKAANKRFASEGKPQITLRCSNSCNNCPN